MAETRDSVECELKRAECLMYTVLRHICLFVYIYLFTPNLEKLCECNRRWLRKGPRSLVIGWDFLDQNRDGLTTGSARYEAILSIGSNRTFVKHLQDHIMVKRLKRY